MLIDTEIDSDDQKGIPPIYPELKLPAFFGVLNPNHFNSNMSE